jgi:hypothetical protein
MMNSIANRSLRPYDGLMELNKMNECYLINGRGKEGRGCGKEEG